MFKFLLIATLSIYILIRVGRFFLTLGRGGRSENPYRKSADQNRKKPQNKSTAKGGEYIDFEEIK